MQLSTPTICFVAVRPPHLPALALLPRPTARLASAFGLGSSAARRLGLPRAPSVVPTMRRRGRRRGTPAPEAAAGGGEAAVPNSQEKVMTLFFPVVGGLPLFLGGICSVLPFVELTLILEFLVLENGV